MPNRGQGQRCRIIEGTFSIVWVAGEENRTASLPILGSVSMKATNPLTLELKDLVTTKEISDTLVRGREMSFVWQGYQQGPCFS